MSRIRLLSLSLIALSIVAPPSLAASQTPDAAALAYLQAENRFDQPALATLLAEGFVEISPRGQLDARDAVIGFYAPGHMVQAPPLKIDTPTVQRHGDAAVVVVPIALEIGGAVRRMTVTITLVRIGGGWKLAAAAYTPRPAG